MKFAARHAFVGNPGYRLLPLRFRRLPWDPDRVLVTSMSGDWLIAQRNDFERAVTGQLDPGEPLFADMASRFLIGADPERTTLAPLLSQYRTRKNYLADGPRLHIFVVSLRCHHTCAYCQVSRQPVGQTAFDMTESTAHRAVDRLFDWPAKTLTIEFQGGEPLLRFDRVQQLTNLIEQRNRTEKRTLRFVIASTLHDLTDEQLSFMQDHGFELFELDSSGPRGSNSRGLQKPALASAAPSGKCIAGRPVRISIVKSKSGDLLCSLLT